jgi:hypothetical protein
MGAAAVAGAAAVVGASGSGVSINMMIATAAPARLAATTAIMATFRFTKRF